jgi:predicted Zn-dependent protease with MMP-like domain
MTQAHARSYNPSYDPSPSIDDFYQMSEIAFAGLPETVKIACQRVVFRIVDYADAATLAGLKLSHPLQLAGLYRGASIGVDIANSGHLPPPEVWLYRAAILHEWRSRGNVTLQEMVTHVLVHEIGHHMGLSDDDIDALEAQPD